MVATDREHDRLAAHRVGDDLAGQPEELLDQFRGEDVGRAPDGGDLAGVPVHRRGFGLVFQDGQLFPHRDVAGNVAFGLRMHRVAQAERERRVTELLELVGLG